MSYTKVDWENRPSKKTPINSANLDHMDQGIADAHEGIEHLQGLNYAPTPAATVAEMTDHDRIYVYTGSETGYEANHWYYWDGTEWAEGGVYNAVALTTDKTISIEDEAADAKVAGDKIRATQKMIAPNYSTSGTYAKGDYVVYSDKLYRAKQAVSSESWTASHWQEVNVGAEIPRIDAGLTTTGQAADAKATGDQVAAINSALSDLDDNVDDMGDDVSALQSSVSTLSTHKVAQPLDEYNQPTDGTQGQSLRTNGDGTTEWADIGLPTDEQTEEAITKWLNEHPEATTTVEDGSLTEAKFTNALKLATIKDYVTPQMFGAKGDGIADDSVAIQNALDSGVNKIYIPKGTYLTTVPLYVNSNCEVFGDGDDTLIYNQGTGWNKNVLCVGFENGVSEPPNINGTTSVAYTKTGKSTFTCDENISVGDIVLFAVGDLTAIGQADSVASMIVEKVDTTYTIEDEIPDGATLYLYSNVPSTSAGGLRLYTCVNSYVHDMKLKNLRTGSSMFGLWLCGANNVIERISVDTNSVFASNLSCHCVVRDCNFLAHNSVWEAAEFIYNSLFENISSYESKLTCETVYLTFAIGRGHGNLYKNCTFSVIRTDGIGGTYARATLEDCKFYGIKKLVGNNFVNCVRCEFNDLMENIAMNIYDCIFNKGSSVKPTYKYARNVVRNQPNTPLSPRECFHLINWDVVYERGVPDNNTLKYKPYRDYGTYCDVYGTGIGIVHSGGTYSAGNGHIRILSLPSGAIRLILNDNSVVSLPTPANSEYTINGTTLTYYEQGSLIH